jgi:hypothetical protein
MRRLALKMVSEVFEKAGEERDRVRFQMKIFSDFKGFALKGLVSHVTQKENRQCAPFRINLPTQPIIPHTAHIDSKCAQGKFRP